MVILRSSSTGVVGALFLDTDSRLADSTRCSAGDGSLIFTRRGGAFGDPGVTGVAGVAGVCAVADCFRVSVPTLWSACGSVVTAIVSSGAAKGLCGAVALTVSVSVGLEAAGEMNGLTDWPGVEEANETAPC